MFTYSSNIIDVWNAYIIDDKNDEIIVPTVNPINDELKTEIIRLSLKSTKNP